MGFRNLSKVKYDNIDKMFEFFWDEYDKEFEYAYTCIYSNFEGGSRVFELTQYLQKYSIFNSDNLIEFFAYVLKMEIIDIKNQNIILVKDIVDIRDKLINRLKVHELVIKLRDCNSFDEYKKIVEIDGLNFIKSIIPKSKLKIFHRYEENVNVFYKLVNYIQSVTLYTEFVKYNVFPKKLLKYRDLIFRYDYLDNGYILDEIPERHLSGNDESGVMKLISRQIENSLVVNNKIPNELVLNKNYHGYLVYKTGGDFENYNMNINMKIDMFVNNIINKYDKYIMEATVDFENVINLNQKKIDLIVDNIIDEINKDNTKKYNDSIEQYAWEKYIEYIENCNILYDLSKHMSTVINTGNIYMVGISKNVPAFGWKPTQKNIKKITQSLEYMKKFTEFYIDNALYSFTDLILVNSQELINYIQENIYNKYENTVNLNNDNDDIVLENNNYKELNIYNEDNTILNNSMVCENNNDEKINIYIERLKHIESYKELSKLAQLLGYDKIRQNGDHGIFKKMDGSTIVIPQGRKIGKGLSLKIQKDMMRNSNNI